MANPPGIRISIQQIFRCSYPCRTWGCGTENTLGWTNKRAVFESSFLKRLGHAFCCGDEILYQPLVDIEIAFVLAKIANLMAFGQYTPYFGTEPQGVLHRLKHNISIA